MNFELNDFYCRKAVSCNIFMSYNTFDYTFKTAVLSFQRSNLMCDDIYVSDIYHIGKRDFLFPLHLPVWTERYVPDICTCAWYLLCCASVCSHVCRHGVSYIDTIMSMCRRKNNTLNVRALSRAHPRTFLSFYNHISYYDLFVLLCVICYSVDIMISHIKHNIQLHDPRCEREATTWNWKPP